MRVLFARLPKPPLVDEQIRIIRKNLLSYYIHSLGLSQINNIDELITCCKILERNRHLADGVNRSSGSCLLEPSLTGNGNNSKRASNRYANVTCFNCNVKGHAVHQCDRPKKKMCYGCGHPGVTIRDGRKCSGKVESRT